jgi:hypothetical protein
MANHCATQEIKAGLRAIERDYPAWHTWLGVPAGLLYARRLRTSPPAVVRSFTVAGLRSQIRQWEAKHRH